ncbi:hypothetical protein ACP275_08G015800 [Erythranthe tilingii]
MLVPLCNCNRHFSFLPSQTVLKPSSQFPACHYPKFTFNPLRRRVAICAAIETDSQTLPQSAIKRIAEKLRSLGYVEDSSNDSAARNSNPGPNSPGEIFVPLPTHLPKYRIGHTLDPSWSTPENPVPEPGSGNAIQRFHELRRGVLEEEEKERIRKRDEGKRGNSPSLAELKLPPGELRRLRSIGIGLKKKLKVGKAGITEGIVNGIHERWRRTELVKITCEDICRLNMKRTHELLEKKTGGLVVWRSGSNIILYRGPDYKYPYFLTDNSSNDSSSEESPDMDNDQHSNALESSEESPDMGSPHTNALESNKQISHPSLVQGVGLPDRVRFQLPGEAEIVAEADSLLEGLGPRFTDWWGNDPLPVDADLLPAVVPGYKRPFRLLPYGVNHKLTNDEMTTLRRLGRPLPIHFALGRNRKHQGLAACIVKLWEKCEIAKIAVKRGVQNTNSVLMAEELKWLTGGTLLSRDREFIVLYRGKDFLPAAVSSAIQERRKYEIDASKTRAGNLSNLNEKEHKHETKEYAAEAEQHNETDQNVQVPEKKRRVRFSELAMERTSTKLSMALEKKARAEKLLEELAKEESPQPPETDKEGITEEERYMLRKVGLRMKAFLLLGRRGVFDGTVENMHLHWKYRELVKVCIGNRSIEEVHGVARTLEAESGGILVAVERVSKGFDIIVYRGKNYTRPASLRPQTLLSKREAMKRSLEAQRRESLKLHVLKLSKNIDELKLKMAKDENTNRPHLTEDLELGFARESHETDATDKGQEEPMHISKDTVHIAQTDYLPGDVSLQSEVKVNYLFETTEAEVQPTSLSNEGNSFSDKNNQIGNMEFVRSPRSQDRGNSSTSSYIRPQTGRRKSDGGGYRNVDIEPSVQKPMKERPSLMPSRSVQLSNKERLLLRKQALRMKNIPILAVGKRNVVTGVAKTIKEHFEKHPLAIVNIKGRAKGTSAQEVIYNLEQSTGAVLVSQEPSKVILYRGWGLYTDSESNVRQNQDFKYDSTNKEVKTRPLISPELISAMRLECGLKPVDEIETTRVETSLDIESEV